jgi:hypothetical protein
MGALAIIGGFFLLMGIVTIVVFRNNIKESIACLIFPSARENRQRKLHQDAVIKTCPVGRKLCFVVDCDESAWHHDRLTEKVCGLANTHIWLCDHHHEMYEKLGHVPGNSSLEWNGAFLVQEFPKRFAEEYIRLLEESMEMN